MLVGRCTRWISVDAGGSFIEPTGECQTNKVNVEKREIDCFDILI
jgi:hypothetical protein